jgi:hypothetical protein
MREVHEEPAKNIVARGLCKKEVYDERTEEKCMNRYDMKRGNVIY